MIRKGMHLELCGMRYFLTGISELVRFQIKMDSPGQARLSEGMHFFGYLRSSAVWLREAISVEHLALHIDELMGEGKSLEGGLKFVPSDHTTREQSFHF